MACAELRILTVSLLRCVKLPVSGSKTKKRKKGPKPALPLRAGLFLNASLESSIALGLIKEKDHYRYNDTIDVVLMEEEIINNSTGVWACVESDGCFYKGFAHMPAKIYTNFRATPESIQVGVDEGPIIPLANKQSNFDRLPGHLLESTPQERWRKRVALITTEANEERRAGMSIEERDAEDARGLEFSNRKNVTSFQKGVSRPHGGKMRLSEEKKYFEKITGDDGEHDEDATQEVYSYSLPYSEP
jgi:hypothetical protein